MVHLLTLSVSETIPHRMQRPWTWTGKDLERSGRGLVGGSIKKLARGDWEKLKPSKIFSNLRSNWAPPEYNSESLHFESHCLAVSVTSVRMCSCVSNLFALETLMCLQISLIYFWEMPDNTIYEYGRHLSRSRRQIALNCKTTVMQTLTVPLELCAHEHCDLDYQCTRD
jgi:hypothetical protein